VTPTDPREHAVPRHSARSTLIGSGQGGGIPTPAGAVLAGVVLFCAGALAWGTVVVAAARAAGRRERLPVDAAYEPCGQPVTRFTLPGNVLLVAPEPGHDLLYSTDGRSWQPLENQAGAASSTVAGRLPRAATTSPPPTVLHRQHPTHPGTPMLPESSWRGSSE